MKEDHGPVALHVEVRDPEVKRILVRRPLETKPGSLDDGFVRRGVTLEFEEHDLADLFFAEMPRREVLRGPHEWA